jgi:tRNA nucleotidyltransferase (CCA-adding enzyme)
METSQWHGKHFSNSDVARHLRNHLLSEPTLSRIVDFLPKKTPLYAVGGVVRDILLDKPVIDIDLATPLLPKVVISHLSRAGIRVIETGIEHGTVLAVIDGKHIEITTFRAPSGRRETKFSSTIEEDLTGRDFTINAMAVSLQEDAFIDPWQGRSDLQEKRLVAVGDPDERFTEDPLRLLRYIRFGLAQRRTPGAATKESVQKLSTRLQEVHPERIQKELSHILLAPEAAAGMREMAECGLLEFVMPELLPSLGCEQNRFHIHDVFEHSLWVLERCPPGDLILRLTAILHDSGKPATVSIGDNGERHFYLHEKVSEELTRKALVRLRYPKKVTEIVANLVRHHMRPLDCGPSGARRIMRDLGDNFSRWRQFKIADSPPLMTAEEFARLEQHFDTLIATEEERLNSIHKLAVDGNDILALGVTKGPKIGYVLNYLKEIAIETPELNRHDALIEAARQFATEKGFVR